MQNTGRCRNPDHVSKIDKFLDMYVTYVYVKNMLIWNEKQK